MKEYTTELIYQNDSSKIVSDSAKTSKRLNIIHFNDVYNIESRDIEPVGGSARFVTLVEEIMSEQPNTLVLFSGDAISPSSSIILNISFKFFCHFKYHKIY